MSTIESPATTILRTSLFEMHGAAGAKMVPFAGWEMPIQYQGVLPEVTAVRESAGLFDVSHMGRVRVRGGDAFAYLQHLTVNDVSRLPGAGGAAQYSLLCREAGGIIDDIIVYRLGPDEFIVVVNASNREKDLGWMRGHTAAFSDLVLEDETRETALIAVQGPKAMDLVDQLSDRDVTVLPRFGLDETVVAGIPTLAARTGYTGEDGVELFCPADAAPDLWKALADAGGVPCGLGARDTLRVEAGLPLYGHEMDEHTHPYEARLGWVVRTDKSSDFLGKNTLKAIKNAPRKKTLVGVAMEGRAIPREGYPVLSGNNGGDAIGYITSGTFSPTLGKGVAMARIAAGHAEKETPVEVLIRDTHHTARVAPLPFYKNV
ncbi:MAG: glycine cleavage system aminomethyltransferase GcvT [Cytophagales bacterium]|nr:glycine cleavage system aminomethyltransferase GcvT [Armatimonadota bacterium]